jgi:hypothetical protein
MSEESEIRTEIRSEGYGGDTTVVPDEPGKPPWGEIVLFGVKGAVLGVMLVLGVLAACCVMEYEGGESFSGWVGLQGHQLLVKPGMKWLIEKHGEDAEYNAPGFIKSYYVLVKLIGFGLALGVLAGLTVGLARTLPEQRGVGGIALAGASGGLAGMLAVYVMMPKPMFLALGVVGGAISAVVLGLVFKRCGPAPEGDDEPESSDFGLPAVFPLGVAIVGLFWHGFVWGNVAILSMPFTRRRRRWLTIVTWVAAFAAVFLWAWAVQTLWEEGWSKQLPSWIKEWIYWAGHLAGMKE